MELSEIKIEEIKDSCTGCGACASFCPKECIVMKYDDEGFYFPFINHDLCISCGMCESKCHILNAGKKQNPSERKSYYGWNLIDSERKISTSGGTFIALAKGIINKGGIVYGAYYDVKSKHLYHTSTENVDLSSLTKSKYLESDMSFIIKDIQKKISNHIPVLFCGTPCEVSGIKSSVKDDENLLLTVDFICHGVPSSKLFKEHLDHLIQGRDLRGIDFRSKDYGWSNKVLSIDTKSKKFAIPYCLDSFYYGFIIANAFLRRSCYECSFRKNHLSDISVADFWMYRNVNINLNDEKGLSVIVGNTPKGLSTIQSLEGFDIHEIDNSFTDYLYSDRNYSKHFGVRSDFYRHYGNCGFEKAAKKTFFKFPFFRKAKYHLKKFIKTILRR